MPGILLWALGPFRRFLRSVLCCTASPRPLLSADLGNRPVYGRRISNWWVTMETRSGPASTARCSAFGLTLSPSSSAPSADSLG
jgi:hypothetical protein